MQLIDDIKNTASFIKYRRSARSVDKAVKIFSEIGLGYSISSGIVGNTSRLNKKEKSRINAAARVLGRNSAGYYQSNTKNKFSPDKPVQSGHYTALKFGDIPFVQSKSFQQANESIHLRAALKFNQRAVYDPRLQAHPNRRSLNLTPEEAQEWAANVESLWRDDKELKDWDESRQNNFAQLSDIAFWDYIAIGEFFAVIRYYSKNPKISTNATVQLYSPFQVASPMFTPFHRINTSTCPGKTVLVDASVYLSELKIGNYIENGIEYNQKGQEIAFFISPVKFGGYYTRIPMETSSGSIQAIHGFIQSEPGQKRGIPEHATAWHEFMNIKDLTIFELQSARLNSSLSGTVTADSNASPNGNTPMNNLGDKKPTWEDHAPVVTDSTDYDGPSYDIREVSGGGYIVQNFPPGYKYQEHKTDRPNVKIPEFIEKHLEFIYPSISGLSVVTVRQRFDGSYNASKGAIDLSWKNGVEYFLKQFSSDWHRPLYQVWLGGKIATGEVSAIGWENPVKRKSWCSMSIITPPKPSLNPLAEAKAATEKTNGGFSNREYESQQLTGTSAEENADRLLQENIKLTEALRPMEELKNMPRTGVI